MFKLVLEQSPLGHDEQIHQQTMNQSCNAHLTSNVGHQQIVFKVE